MAIIPKKQYKEWLENKPIGTIYYERGKLRDFISKYENDRLAPHEIDPLTPPHIVYSNAKDLLVVLEGVLAEREEK